MDLFFILDIGEMSYATGIKYEGNRKDVVFQKKKTGKMSPDAFMLVE
jgi:hypothetical protein